jgi:hypothetical protein
VITGGFIDQNYAAGQQTTYYLVVGNLIGATVFAGQASIRAIEYKR